MQDRTQKPRAVAAVLAQWSKGEGKDELEDASKQPHPWKGWKPLASNNDRLCRYISMSGSTLYSSDAVLSCKDAFCDVFEPELFCTRMGKKVVPDHVSSSPQQGSASHTSTRKRPPIKRISKMFARKGIVAATVASSRSAHFSILRHTDQSAALSFRITRLFSSSPARSASESARVPRPIPLDIGNGPTASSASAITEAASLSSSTAEAAVAGSARRSYRSSNNGSFFGRFGEPIINVLIYSTAASLVLHLIYHHLALEEYRIASNKKIADLEAEIETIKSRNASSSVQHSLGGRGEFV